MEAVLPSGHHLKVPVCHRSDYDILYEHWAGFTFIHVDVRRWSHRVQRAFLKDVNVLHEILGGTVYALAEPDDARHHHFLAISGFIHTGQALSADGRPMLGFERSLTGGPHGFIDGRLDHPTDGRHPEQ